jgi:DNA-binding GntR family transcriptional regulator
VAPRPGEEAFDADLVRVVSQYFMNAPTRGRTTEAVTDALREAILDGVLAPAAWLREEELAEIFAVSRTPVREALRRLADEGLALKTAHHGTVVASLSLEDVLALYVVREDLEALASRLAAAPTRPGLVARLESIHADMLAVEPGANASNVLAQQNLEFHRALRRATGNSYLEKFLAQVEHAVRRLPGSNYIEAGRRIPGSTYVQAGRTEEMLAEHAAIIAAIAAGDGDAAESSARTHMRKALEIRLAVMLDR